MTRPATVLVDLRVAQINGDRGIPAYSQSLTLELARTYPRHHWLLLHDPHRPPPARVSELSAHAKLCSTADLEGDGLPAVDVLLTACFFFVPHKGPTFEAIVPPATWRHRPRRMGIVYDLIPLLFPDRYLTNEHARQVYLESLDIMRASDHLFAISHATRRDTILRAAVDPRRVHCIYGDIDQTKQSLMARAASETADVPARHGLTGPYCAYVGGDDWRKNLNVAVQAFARFWRVHSKHRLAIVCKLPKERIAALHRLAADEGLPPGALICTGYVSDEDLVGLVRHADMVVFPSLYEGLGLPVLEAYGCGTPVVGSNTSSVAELVLPELACDPHDPAAIAGAMSRLVTEPPLRHASLALGRRLMAEELGWSRAARCVMEHIEERARMSVVGRTRAGRPAEKSTCRVAIVTALPVGDLRSRARSLPSLADSECCFTLYDANHRVPLVPPSSLAARPRVLPIEAAPAALLRGNHDLTIFVLDGSPSDRAVTEAMDRTRRTPSLRLLWIREPAVAGFLDSAECGATLRQLIDRSEIDTLVVDTDATRDRLHDAVRGDTSHVTIDVATCENHRSDACDAAAPSPAGACSRGAA